MTIFDYLHAKPLSFTCRRSHWEKFVLRQLRFNHSAKRHFDLDSSPDPDDHHIPSTWPPNLLSRASALSRSSLTSSRTERSQRSPPESAREAEDGTRTSVLVSGPPRPPSRATTLVCEYSMDGAVLGRKEMEKELDYCRMQHASVALQ